MFDHRLPIAMRIALALSLLLLPLAAEAQETEAAPDPYLYSIDTSHTSVGFKVRHFTVSNVRGKFETLEGAIRYNPDDLRDSGVEVTIAADSINTNHGERDDHLRSPDFLDVENHPVITFESTRVEMDDDGWIMNGNLTIRGVTKPVSFRFDMAGPIADPFGMQRMGIEGELAIDRREWGLNWSRAMETGGLFVGHKVKIEINAEATRR